MRRFVLTQPARDFGELGSVEPAIAAIRQATRDLGLSPERGVRVRLTGAPAIENDELKTLSDGAELSLGLSFGLVTLVLFLALRSGRLILPIVITLIAGLVATAGFAALAVGTLNPISVAFAVLFLGLAADFSIQVAVRYREERFLHPDPAVALRQTGAGIAGALTLAAGANAVGFFSFLPTAYVGVSQLGLIAGVGMLIALAYNFTLLPALIALFRPPGEAASVGFARAVPVDRWLVRHRLPVSLAAVLAALAGLAAIPALRFDFNPMNLRDAKTESVATALDLFDNPDTTPFSIDLLVPSAAQARALAARLEALPEVHRALALTSFVPEDQEAKLALIEDAALLLGPTLSPGTVAPPPSPQAVRETLAATLAGLARSGASPVAVRLAGLIDQVLHRDEGVLARLERNLMAGLPARLADLREALAAAPASLDSLPESLRRDWVAPDGAYRIHVAPTGDATDNAVLIRFVEAVRALAPEATGPAVTIQGSAHTIIRAFLEAGAISLVTVVLLLWLILRRWSDVVLVLVPLMLSALLTVITCVTLGPALNFANVIALPLLLGIGVAFNIYFVVNHRHDGTGPLQSSTARAVLFSALTTVVAFGSLALSNHPGTASMGVLLTISLGYTLLTTLVVLPALLGWKAGWSQRIAAATAPGFSRAPPAAGGTP
jgi:hopanoid biosynthesis associated RND transporter like protein HpnN